ncbi:MAG: 6-phosphogluconolactonase [Candidatus Dadabacteria bacterium]|nr:MAG: 6-phosphogluconolactonase [Candidatus Dadabacteria bacterium]
MASSIEVIDTKSFPGVVADEIVLSIQEAIDDHGTCLVSLAGGKTPANVYRLLSRPPRVNDVEWSKVVLFLGDERWVAADDIQSNQRMVRETLLSNLSEQQQPEFVTVNTSLATPDEGASDYSDKLKQVFTSYGRDKLDLVLLGVGEDGHFASVFPGSPLLNGNAAGLAASAQAPDKKSWRVTLTPEVLFSASRILFIVSGGNKADVLKSVLEEDGNISVLPARAYRQAKGSVTWFVDSEAGIHLNRA